jgi:predicted secreted hydrolase
LGEGGALRFPRAYGAHPGAALEWWYVTVILDGPQGLRLGSELTFFRAGLGSPPPGASAWLPGDFYFAHFAVSDLSRRGFIHDGRTARTGVAVAGADSSDLDVWIRDWRLRRSPDGAFQLYATGEPGTLSLTLTPGLPRPVAWGPAYVSYKDSAGTTFSRYQSYPRMRAVGTFSRPGEPPREVAGLAWFDHEWSDGRLAPGIVGWDWMGLRIGEDRALMLYRMRSREGRAAHVFGGLVGRDGSVMPILSRDVRLRPLRYWVSRRTGARYPVAWRLRVAPKGPGGGPEGGSLELTITAPLLDQELTTPRSTRVTYWEGVVEGSAREGTRQERVEGYLELTGYAGDGAPGWFSTSEPPGR